MREISRMKCITLVWCLLLVAPACKSFLSPLRGRQVAVGRSGSQDASESDLFDYFDPLRSPHDYPDGIGPDRKPKESRKEMEDQDPELSHGLDLFQSDFPTALAPQPTEESEAKKKIPKNKFASSSSSKDNQELDLFDYFDPLRSPHDYPDGIGPDSKPKESHMEDQDPKLPRGLDLFQSEFPSAFAAPPHLPTGESEATETTLKTKFAPSSSSKEDQELDDQELDLFEIFDPTLSPHAYPNGIPSTKNPKQAKMVGILLMDHGSRNEASNQRLQDLACIYQNTLGDRGPSKVIVKAAHMEIASPSIPEALQKMVESGVDEIICHPYFLSPGRHVREDIPQIIDEAVESIGIEVPITTTPQLGSHTDLMISAIHSLVEESSALLKRNPN